ncbi:MAG: 50S ribosomal protein L4 [Candidatus Latescibacteria bacterium]|nr:50S ribosomal protein L4 [Candidatus Latescibacterota bacterium]
MKSVPVLTLEGIPSGVSVDLPESLFEVEPSEAALYYSVKAYLAHQRQGTASTKNRSAVDGSTAKLYRQKGTGRARAGMIRSPLRRGGGTIFGPMPRTYDEKVPKKVRRLAFRSALSLKAREDLVRVIEDFVLPVPSTRQIVALLKVLNVEGQKVLFVFREIPSTVLKSCRNLPRVTVRSVGTLCAYDVLNCDILACTAGALSTMAEMRG